jgi:major membrane immunogen (membrane-anchored lipoprotein)
MMSASTLGRRGGITLVLALTLLLAGCTKSKLTKANYDKINNGMTVQEVEAILGRGDPQGDGSAVAGQFGVDTQGLQAQSSTVDYLWQSGNKSVTVTFRGGKVAAKKSEGL